MRMWIEPWALEYPVFRSPLRLGIVIHLVAFSRADNPIVVFNARELALRMDVRKNAFDTAVQRLQQDGIIRLEKGVPKKGMWTVDLSQMSQFMHGTEWLKAPADCPAELMMKEWSERYREAMGRPWVRTKSGFWMERSQWVSLLEQMSADRVVQAMRNYLDDPESRRMGCTLKYFIVKAPSLQGDRSMAAEWRFQSKESPGT
jgi:hypothetical protein